MSETLNASTASEAVSLQALIDQGQALTEIWHGLSVPDRPLSEEAMEVLYILGLQALQAEKYTEAQGVFAILLHHFPANSNYLAGMGNALNGDGDLSGGVMLHALALQSASLADKTAHALALVQSFIAVRQPEAAQAVLDALPSSATAIPFYQQLQARAEAVRALIDRVGH
jgi:hypothetical protein